MSSTALRRPHEGSPLWSRSGSKNNVCPLLEGPKENSSRVDSDESGEEKLTSEREAAKLHNPTRPPLRRLTVSHSTTPTKKCKKKPKGPVGLTVLCVMLDGRRLARMLPYGYGMMNGLEIPWGTPCQVLKEVKPATYTSGATSQSTLTPVESLASQWMTPRGWSPEAKACLAGGKILLWKGGQ